ncbi:hypothetical protein [Simiduia agarivorans]|uniref:Surface antigen (D15) n=1 Tax=Simiduia agarivorans (strain DSM 21679 / JCM 13881 / BCRC 17597 / SA1) TaxID=1117647 RepID=K4KZI7_SIMAS|nr:hypothetical protein [Simiduia agarivorans]AFU99342.1 surface antigen (D15) [Simiduia agarivorans SA1 = DSM 21679]
MTAIAACAFTISGAASEDTGKESPWILTPTASSSPKLGNSLGFLAGYLHHFDKRSPASIFAVAGSLSDTQSSVYGAFAKTYLAGDQHRIIGALGGAKIENEYKDYLGTGLDIRTTDDATFGMVRYLYRLPAHWFVGGQLISTNYEITGKDDFSKAVLALFDVSGFQGSGWGLVAERDSRDHQNDPHAGSYFQFSSTRFNSSLSGNADFDTWSAKYSLYTQVADKHLLATRITARVTADAPTAAFSSVGLRGYTAGEYLAPHNTTIEIEHRYQFGERWGATAFLGASCLYGGKEDCGESENWYPAAGAGITYLLKPQEKMIVRTEIAVGKNDNYGFYIQFGNAF